ncbi:thioesterase [Bombilactobacillus folatiphilus]|uniref:Thioesterase n=1 Tax=Bombilactobacillus folatiphilus TaxID=2923362 RepID=A0ABY4P9T2_9LACO|nr:acyl-ACP thioesterase domain-containing protein [Bombilactobacillus folatiphilus]UQS82427.1 thioesterase [Bombilactobacillus folatiphilus]
MSKRQYTESLTVPYFDIDMTKNMKLSALFNEILWVSESQLKEVGIDSQHMVAQGIGWVVTKYHLEITRMPHLNEAISITTEANSYNKFFCYRTFTVQDASGQEIVKLTSNWVMLDIQSRKMMVIKSEIMEQLNCPYSTEIWRFPRIDLVEHTDQPIAYPTRFFDIDINGHVNNAVYLDWMLDSLGRDFLMAHQLQQLDIKYEQEVQYGDTVESFVQQEGLTTHHLIKTSAGINAQAQAVWQQN